MLISVKMLKNGADKRSIPNIGWEFLHLKIVSVFW